MPREESSGPLIFFHQPTGRSATLEPCSPSGLAVVGNGREGSVRLMRCRTQHGKSCPWCQTSPLCPVPRPVARSVMPLLAPPTQDLWVKEESPPHRHPSSAHLSSQGWTWHSPSCYWLGEDQVTYSEARRLCTDHGSQLVTITNRYRMGMCPDQPSFLSWPKQGGICHQAHRD